MGESRTSSLRPGQGAVVLACCSALALSAVAPVLAQDEGGLKLSFGISSTLRSDSNYALATPSNGRGTVFDTNLSFGLESVTRTSSLSFRAATTARTARLPAPAGNTSGFEEPTLQLAYTRQGARSRLSFSARYNQADLDFLDPLRDPILIADPTLPGGLALVTETGQRTNLQYSLGFETGIDSPVGFSLQASRRELDYTNTVSPNLFDTETDSLSASLRLDLTPASRLTLTGSATDYEAANTVNTRRENRSLGLGYSAQLDEATELSARIGWSEVRVEETGGTTLREGMTFGFGASRALAVGSLGVSYDRSLDSNGARDTINLRHTRETQTLDIGLGLGLTRGTTGTTSVIADVSLEKALPRGAFTFGLSRSVATNNNLADVLYTRANASYTHEIDTLSSVSLGATYARTEDGGAGNTATSSRSALSVTYNRALTEDWRMSAGYEHRRLQNTTGDTSGNAIFVTLGRSFEFRP